MKILLIQPAKSKNTIGGEDVFMFEPLALEYLASGIIADHEVKILDLRIDKNLKDVFDEFKPDIVGITAYTVNVNTVKRLFKDIKSWNPDVFTVVGGHHATVAPDDFINPAIDLIVMGEGVFVFKEILQRLKKNENFDGIQGIIYSKDGELIKTPAQIVDDLDVFPFPVRSLTEKYRKHYYSEWMKPLASIRTSKGCPFRCNFCALWKMNGGKYISRKPENIVKELLEIKEKFVFFSDDESLVDAKKMMELARLIKEAGIKKRYFLYGRSDTIVKHPDLIEKWKEIGLEKIFIGLESFKEEDLISIKKKSTIAINEEAVKILQKLKIEIYPSFMVRPEFTKEDFKEFKKYCRKLKFNFASFSVLTPLPGTDFYEEVKDKLITHNYDYFDFLHTLLPTELPLKEYYKELSVLYKEAISPVKSIQFLMKYPWQDQFKMMIRSYKLLAEIKGAYEYEEEKEVCTSTALSDQSLKSLKL